MSRIYDFSPLTTAPQVRREAAAYGAPQIVTVPDTSIPSPLAPNLAPQTVKNLKEFLTGCGPDGTGFKPGCERGVEIWEAWKRAWDLWNNHYIEGRVCPTFIRQEYNRIKALMETDNDRRRRRRPLGGVGRAASPNGVQLVYTRVFSLNKPTRTLPTGRIWVRHRYRTQKIQVPTGQKVRQNNPNPPSIQRQVSRIARRLVQEKAGDTVKVFRKVARSRPGTEIRVVRANGPWTRNLTSWADLGQQRIAGTLTAPAESETTAEPGLEPLGISRITRQVNITSKHLDYIDIMVEHQPHPLMSWKDITTARQNGRLPNAKGRTDESQYEPSRPQVWLPDEYDLVDTGATEVLLDDRTAEVEGTEQATETVLGNPIVEVDVTTEVTIRQWLEIDAPGSTRRRTRRQSQESRAPTPPTDGDDPPNLPPPVTPRSDPLDSLVNGTRNCPEYAEWERNLPARWDAVNPRRLSSTNDPEWIKWRDFMKSEVTKQWANLLRTGAFFQGPTHSNGNPAFEDPALSRSLERGGDEDMADVSDQEYQNAFGDDEDMEDYYEQRGMGAGPGSDIVSQASDDDWSSENDMFEADDGDGGGDGAGPGSESDSSSGSSSASIDLGPPPRGLDGGAGGFYPLKVFPEYLEPVPDVNGDFPDWTDNIQNTVWRPRRVGEKTLKVDLDEAWEKITDLEVDGGLDCGRSPYPVLRSVNRYVRNEIEIGTAEAQRKSITFRKEKIWDGVTGSIFNMPTRPDEADPETLDEREGRIKVLYDELDLDERPRHDLFPLDIRRIKTVDPATGRPYESEIKQDLPDGETESDFDLPWSNPVRPYPDLKDTDPWWVTPEQERLRDVPPRRHPPADDGRTGGRWIPLDAYRWNQERLLDENNQAHYFVTNLHGGTMLINGAEVMKGCIAGPLPDFAVIETLGGQVSFWWGAGGRNWGNGPENADYANNWRQLRRLPGWKHAGLNSGVVWNRIIRDRLVREESGNDEEDDQQWEEWKKPPLTPSPSGTSSGGGGGNNNGANDNDKPVDKVHPPVEICLEGNIGPACSLNAFRAPDLFETEEVELEWLHTRAQPLREAVVGLVGASQQQVEQLKALSSLIDPDPDIYWPGVAQPPHPEIPAQQAEESNWPTKKAQVLMDQAAGVWRADQRRMSEEVAKDTAYQNSIQAASTKRQLEQTERNDQTRRTRQKLEQGIRDAQTNYVQAQATSLTQQQDKARQEKHQKLVLEEAANLTRIIGLASTPDMAQVTAAAATRRTQRAQELLARTAKLNTTNAARNNRGLKVIAAQPQLSAAEFDIVLIDACAYLRPTRDAEEAAAAKVIKDAADKRIKDAMKARAARELQERRVVRRNAQSLLTGPAKQADIDREERRKRYQAAVFRQDAQREKDAADRRRADEQKRQRDAEEQRRAAAEVQRLEAARKAAEAARQAALAQTSAQQAAAAQLQLQQQNDNAAAIQAALNLAADQERALRVNRVPLTTPGPMNAAQKQVYDDAVRERDSNIQQMRQYISNAAASANMSEDAWVQTQHGYRDVADYIGKFDYDEGIRRAMPTAVRVLTPYPNTPGDSPPAGTPRGPDINPDPPAPTTPGGSTSAQPWKQLMEFREATEAAVAQGLRARARLEGIPVWQAAHKRKWWSLRAMTNHYVNAMTVDDCVEQHLIVNPALPTRTQTRLWMAANKKILDANDWEAIVLLVENNPPVVARPLTYQGVV